MSKGKIPTEEDFARASASLEKGSRGLNQIRESILCNYSREYKLHEFFIYDSTETSFRAYVFFEKEKDLKMAKKNREIEKIKLVIFKELERVERGGREEVDVVFEFDSHENVESKFEGNYFNRLR